MKKNLKIGLGIIFSCVFLLVFFYIGWNWGFEYGWDSAIEWDDEWWLNYLEDSTRYTYNNVLNRCMNYMCQEIDVSKCANEIAIEVVFATCMEKIFYKPKVNYTEYLTSYNPELDFPLT